MTQHGTDLTRGGTAEDPGAEPGDVEDATDTDDERAAAAEADGGEDDPAPVDEHHDDPEDDLPDDPDDGLTTLVDPDEDQPVSDRTTLAIGVVMAIVTVAIVGMLVLTGGDDGGGGGGNAQESQDVRPTTAVFGTLDEFDRPDAQELGRFTTDRAWNSLVGRWGIEDGDAYVVQSAEFRNHAVVGLGQGDGAVQVRLDRLTAGAGLVFRFRGPGSYWAVLAAPNGGTWNLVRVEDTVAEVVDNTGVTPVTDGTTVAARFVGEEIEVIVNGIVRLTVQDDFLSDEGLVGMTVRGEDATEARFDDFVAALPGNRPLFVGGRNGAASTTTVADGG